MYWTRPAAYATSGHRSPVTSRATWTKLLKCELRMNRPLARAGRTPISSRVRIVEAPPAVGVGSGEPCRITAGGEEGIARMDVVSGPLDVAAGRGSTATPPAGVAEAADAGAATPEADVLPCGRRAIIARSSFTVSGRWAGCCASAFCRCWSGLLG